MVLYTDDMLISYLQKQVDRTRILLANTSRTKASRIAVNSEMHTYEKLITKIQSGELLK